jgi:hypothetical protein
LQSFITLILLENKGETMGYCYLEKTEYDLESLGNDAWDTGCALCGCTCDDASVQEEHASRKKATTVIDEASVINSEGTLALMIDGYDVLYLNKVDGSTLTKEEHQEIIDAITKALGV